MKCKSPSGKAVSWEGHSNEPALQLEKVSHIVESLIRSGNRWIGRARLIDAGAGRVAQALVSAGAKIGISSKGTGTISEDKLGRKVVQNDYVLLGCDLVHEPSGHHAGSKRLRAG